MDDAQHGLQEGRHKNPAKAGKWCGGKHQKTKYESGKKAQKTEFNPNIGAFKDSADETAQ